MTMTKRAKWTEQGLSGLDMDTGALGNPSEGHPAIKKHVVVFSLKPNSPTSKGLLGHKSTLHSYWIN